MVDVNYSSELEDYYFQRANDSIYDYLCNNFDFGLGHINPVYLLQNDSFGQTMLHWASVKGDLGITKFIIDKTGDQLLNLRTYVDSYTALHLAVYGRNNKVIDLLLEKNEQDGFVDLADKHGRTALYMAVVDGNLEACRKLYHRMTDKAICLQPGDHFQSMLHLAVKNGDYNIVELLVSKDQVAKQLFGKVDKYNQNPLHWAAGKLSNQAEQIVDLFIKVINGWPDRRDFYLFRTDQGYTALHIAVQSDNNESVKSLIKATRDTISEFVPAVDKYGQTALHWAASKGNLVACQYLSSAMKPEDIIIQSDTKQTALHFAAQAGHGDVFNLLVKNIS